MRQYLKHKGLSLSAVDIAYK